MNINGSHKLTKQWKWAIFNETMENGENISDVLLPSSWWYSNMMVLVGDYVKGSRGEDNATIRLKIGWN